MTAIDEVKGYLSNCTNDVLLVLDNCDDASLDYAIYMPSGSRMKIVITTRLPECSRFASKDDSNIDDHENLEGLDADSALALILKESGTSIPANEDRQAAGRRMAKVLGFHPLAMIVGSAVVRDGICSLKEYPAMFEAQKAYLLKQGSRQMRSRYGDVYTTFEVSAHALQESQDPAAQQAIALLGILAFMHRQSVREDIFTRAWEYEEQLLNNVAEYSTLR